jgi:tetratricopeptide (TPR) repeat protein
LLLLGTALLLQLAVDFDPAAATGDLLGPSRARLASLEARLDDPQEAVERARLLLQTGRHDEAHRLVGDLMEGDLDAKVLAGRILEAVHDFGRLETLVESLQLASPDDWDVRSLVYRWWFLIDDLERVERTLQKRRSDGEFTLADAIASAELQLRLLGYEEARAAYVEILSGELPLFQRTRALRGLGVALHRERQFDDSLAKLTEALALSPLDADVMAALADTLIRHGRTDEAIEAAEFAVGVAPYHLRSHYLLGSGYARRNYTQFYAAYPGSFADEEGRASLRGGDVLLEARRVSGARKAYETVRKAHPRWADAAVRLGSLEYAERNYTAARGHFEEALQLRPEYGRAHTGLARSLEAQRLAVEVHRRQYEESLERARMPEVPGIDDFVINWAALSPRHQKRLALSVEPWRRYLPVLIEAGATLYVKQLYQLLSETPGQELLRDQRISYDSRLWDDVRGCGGYHTVAGIEDVEQLVYNGYDTVLHEISHQVHSVLTEDRKREIQDLYAETKRRDESTGEAFLSRYASGSVWEYFAEGANALRSPRRDRFDTREIVRERLEDRDEALQAIARRIMLKDDVEPSYAVAYVTRGDDRLQRGKPEEALDAYRKALKRSPGDESTVDSHLYALAVMGRTREALEASREASGKMPESAAVALRLSDALWVAGEGLPAAIGTLQEARSKVRAQERYRIDQELGLLHWTAGDAPSALAAFQAVLEYQADSPAGLWGAAGAEALAGRWEKAWALYDKAVRHRTGIVDLRTDYARDLIRAGELERAAEQIDAALLLDPEDPEALAIKGWWHLQSGRIEEARAFARRARDLGPWCALADLVEAAAERRAGNPKASERLLEPLRDRIHHVTAPEYVYRKKWGRYDRVFTLPAIERALLPG